MKGTRREFTYSVLYFMLWEKSYSVFFFHQSAGEFECIQMQSSPGFTYIITLGELQRTCLCSSVRWWCNYTLFFFFPTIFFSSSKCLVPTIQRVRCSSPQRPHHALANILYMLQSKHVCFCTVQLIRLLQPFYLSFRSALLDNHRHCTAFNKQSTVDKNIQLKKWRTV